MGDHEILGVEQYLGCRDLTVIRMTNDFLYLVERLECGHKIFGASSSDLITLLLRLNMFNYQSHRIGLLFLVLCLPSFTAPAIGNLSDRIGARIVVGAGFLGLAISTFLLKSIDNIEDQYAMSILSVLLLLIDLGLSLVLIPVFADVTYMIEQKAAA